MKRNFFMLLAFLGSVVWLSSCSKSTPVTYSFTSQAFVNRAASSFNFQIQAGTLAQSKGVNDSVKAYGALMVSDNTTSLKNLNTLAASKGLSVPTTLVASDQSNLTTLQSESGTSFDQSYAQTMILTHNLELSFFNLAAQYNGVADADLRNFAFNLTPLLSIRAQEAYQLQTIVATKQ